MSQGNGVLGAGSTRRAGRWRWERYRVTHPFSPRDQAGLWAAIVGVVALAMLVGWALDTAGSVVIVAAAPAVISWFEKRRTAFQFDAAGALFAGVRLPWSQITQFVVATPQGGRTLIGARLHPGVSVPAGVNTPPRHPAMPAPVHVAVPSAKFDLAKMVRKARVYAPSHVQIVVAEPSGERVVS